MQRRTYFQVLFTKIGSTYVLERVLDWLFPEKTDQQRSFKSLWAKHSDRAGLQDKS